MAPQRIRLLKISYAFGNASHPRLNLMGAWLQQAGFSIGQRALVHVANGKLTVEALPQEDNSNE